MLITVFNLRRHVLGTFCAALLAVSSPTWAANANFEVTVVPVAASASSPASVSLGRDNLMTYAAYRVSITNSSGNTNNAIRFNAGTEVSGDFTAAAVPTDAGAVAPYVEFIGPAPCTGSGSAVECNIPQMKAGANHSFVMIFSAPQVTAAAQWANSAAIRLAWKFDYASGNSSATPSSILCNGVTIANPPCEATETTALITTVSDAILQGFVTYIPSFGGTFFTGSGASVLPPDGTNLRPTAAAKITVPAGQGLSTALVDLTVEPVAFSGDTTTTITGLVQVPNGGQLFQNYAVIELRRDASTIRSGAKIANAFVTYSHNEITPVFWALNPCPAGGFPNLNEPVCIADRIAYTRKNAPTPADIGDWLFIIHALENGVSRW